MSAGQAGSWECGRTGAMADSAQGLDAYAAARGLTVEDGVHLPRTTPLLAEGEVHSVEALASGWFSKYVEAKIAVISRGDAQFTVAVTHVPKAKRFVSWMLCHRTEDEHQETNRLDRKST